jgi:SRSO17 transposase
VTTHDNSAVAAGLSVDPGRWREQFDELMGRIAGRFARVEPRRRARAFVLGLVSGLRRKNCWTIAEQAGDASPDGMQHLPGSWLAGPARCAAAGISATAVFATKPGLARRMVGRALDAGIPAAWVTGDEVYGADPGLRADLERRRTGYVLAVAASHQVSTAAGPCQARTIAARLPRQAWQRYSAGAGAKGHRYYDWAWAAIDPGQPGHRHLLIRRNRRTRELAFYRCYSPRRVPLPLLVKVAGIRWTTQENFQAGKGLAGLDEHQVRRWDSWYRWTTLAMLALAFLSIAAATEPPRHRQQMIRSRSPATRSPRCSAR